MQLSMLLFKDIWTSGERFTNINMSDRHASITKHMREELTNITHYFNIWHLKKSMLRVAFDFLLVEISANWQGDRGDMFPSFIEWEIVY